MRIYADTSFLVSLYSPDVNSAAAALELNADCIYSFDQQQRKLAQHLHLKLN